uniref:Uncharacterized protein n=1 Tax=Timema shepardi TaxID=629360 RepID=A0A7R9B2K1_TIMSH|nr:unnamed protein product [Timema shepardi]
MATYGHHRIWPRQASIIYRKGISPVDTTQVYLDKANLDAARASLEHYLDRVNYSSQPTWMGRHTEQEDEINQNQKESKTEDDTISSHSVDSDVISLNAESSCPITVSENSGEPIDDSGNNITPHTAIANVGPPKPGCSGFKTPKSSFPYHVPSSPLEDAYNQRFDNIHTSMSPSLSNTPSTSPLVTHLKPGPEYNEVLHSTHHLLTENSADENSLLNVAIRSIGGLEHD